MTSKTKSSLVLMDAIEPGQRVVHGDFIDPELGIMKCFIISGTSTDGRSLNIAGAAYALDIKNQYHDSRDAGSLGAHDKFTHDGITYEITRLHDEKRKVVFLHRIQTGGGVRVEYTLRVPKKCDGERRVDMFEKLEEDTRKELWAAIDKELPGVYPDPQ